MADVKYTVVKGDTLSEIAQKYLSKYGRPLGFTSVYNYVDHLAKTNNISNPNYIVVGQVIILNVPVGEVRDTAPARTRPVIKQFGIQSNSDNTMFATWKWDRDHTKEYKTMWYYATGDGVWFVGSDSTTTYKQSTYSIPSNATKIKFKVRAISKTHKVNNKDTSYWTAQWSTEKVVTVSSITPPTKPSSAPSVKIENYKLTAELDNLASDIAGIQFQIVKDDSKVYKTADVNVNKAHVAYSCGVSYGSEYKVRCRSYKNINKEKEYSEWTEYSDNYITAPAPIQYIKTIKALTETSVYLNWDGVKNSKPKTYEIQYTTQKRYFDSNSQEVTSINDLDATKVSHAEITGLESGKEYFFRLRAVNDAGESPWTQVISCIVGKAPSAPTTWSSTTTVISGEDLVLYWVHNSEDGSKQSHVDLEILVNGVNCSPSEEQVLKGDTASNDTDETNVIHSYKINTSSYVEGCKIEWRVRTKGIVDKWSDWSIKRTVNVYSPPTLELEVTDVNGWPFNDNIVITFPFYIKAEAGPSTQKPISYHIDISATESYKTFDSTGNAKNVSAGEIIYSKNFDQSGSLSVEMTPSDINLENNSGYNIECTVAMDSGLTAKASWTFFVKMNDGIMEPNAELYIDKEELAVNINPYTSTLDGKLFKYHNLSVYRRELDGTFTEIATDIASDSNTFVTDLHPSLDFARYRIVAVDIRDGSVSYYDTPETEETLVGCKSIIIQWDEDVSNYSYKGEMNEDAFEIITSSSTMLKLPYNVDVSDNNDADVELVGYIGRKHPVSYYGTQLGQKASWSADIDKNDTETLNLLRRLQIWMGDVYVREPSGSGYWASVSVSFSQKHCEKTIPVSIDITRVEGGA